MTFKENGIRNSPFRYSKEEIKILKDDWQKHASKIKRCPKKKFKGRGIVYTAGGLSYLTCAWVSISVLRERGCELPIEIWHNGPEISEEVKEKFIGLNVRFMNFQALGDVSLQGYMLKPLAIIASSFSEVLYLDTDNICTRNPQYLFDCLEYKEEGCIFWPDYWHTSKSNSIWSIIGSKHYEIPEQESGQILVDKTKCWKELQLSLYFNQMSAYYYKLILGDKDTFKFAWHALESKYYMIKEMVGTCGIKVEGRFHGNTMVQHDPDGNILFLHRNLLKWDLTQSGELGWSTIKRFKNIAKTKKTYFRRHVKIGLSIDLDGDVLEDNFEQMFGNLEERCLWYLDQWRSSEHYTGFCTYMHILKNRLN